MVQNSFKVIFSRKDLVSGSFASLSLEFIIILMVQLNSSDGLRNLLNSFIGIVFLNFLPIVTLYLIITRLLFCIKVEGVNIIYKTLYGRKYSFTCKDIKKVACLTERSAKHGISHEISIKVDIGREQIVAYMLSDMKGFSMMASYLLEMNELGEIKGEAISPKARKMLTRYRDLGDK